MLEHLSLIDWLVIAFYLAGVLLLGLYASGSQRNTRDYFLGDRRLPWWAVTLSIVATETSAVTYIGVPGLAYRSGSWYFLQLVIGYALARVFLAIFFIGIFYRVDATTVYEFLQTRFGTATRTVAAFLFLSGRVIASGVRLFAACFAVHIATGLSIELAIVGLGALGVAYTLAGGIRAVVWSDFILGLTFLAGGLIAIVFLVSQIDGGLGAVLADSDFPSKLRIFHFGSPDGTWSSFFASDRPLLIGLVGGFVLTLATHGTDQDIVQRALSCEDGRAGARSMIASAFVILPMMALFLAIGTLLWFRHKLDPTTVPELPPGIAGQKEDYYFPLFIVQDLPRGVAGIIFAGIFAAALSSLTSVLNALSATAITDFYRPLRGHETERHYLRASRVCTLGWGIVLVVVAMGFIDSGNSIITVALQVLAYFYGSLLGVFLLGIFTKRGSALSTTLGMLVAVPCVLLLQLRAFVVRPENAPNFLRLWIEGLPDDMKRQFTETILPFELGWPLWIIVGTVVTFCIGVLGREVIARRV